MSLLCEMRSPSFFCFLCLVLAGSETQKVLRVHEHHSTSPLDLSFDKKVEWALKYFKIPGLDVAVSHGEIYSKVSNRALRELAMSCLPVLELTKELWRAMACQIPLCPGQ